jgi:hypothetical protein
MLKARLKPEAKNPPKGATREAKMARTIEWSWKGAHGIELNVLPVWGGIVVSWGKEDVDEVETYESFERGDGPDGEGEVTPHEHTVGSALDVGEDVRGEVLGGADHVVESHEEGSPLWTASVLSVRVGDVGHTTTAKTMVTKKAPTNPSTVFLGESLIN